MIIEKVDPNSGAILFKKDKESRDLEEALKRIKELEGKVSHLETVLEWLVKEREA